MKSSRTIPFLAASLLYFIISGAAHATVIIGNLNGNDGSQSAGLSNLRVKGMGFSMPAGIDYELNSVTLRLELSNINVNPIVQIWGNVTSLGLPSAPLITLVNPTFPSIGISNFDFAPPHSFNLSAGNTYWLVASAPVSTPTYSWRANLPAITPTGIATHFGALFDTNGVPPTVVSNTMNSYAINATAIASIPEPSSLGIFAIGIALFSVTRRTKS